jgi:hypothetical protein
MVPLPFFFPVLGFELWALCLLGRDCTAWAMPPAVFVFKKQGFNLIFCISIYFINSLISLFIFIVSFLILSFKMFLSFFFFFFWLVTQYLRLVKLYKKEVYFSSQSDQRARGHIFLEEYQGHRASHCETEDRSLSSCLSSYRATRIQPWECGGSTLMSLSNSNQYPKTPPLNTIRGWIFPPF